MHSKPSRNAEPGRKRQIGINLFPVIVSAPLMALLAFVSFIFISDLQRIKNLALSTSNSHLPQVLAKQQMLLNVENMRWCTAPQTPPSAGTRALPPKP